MSQSKAIKNPSTYHRFIDEAGDPTFFGKGKVPILGSEGVSKVYMLGMLKYQHPLSEVRSIVEEFTKEIADDPYFNKIPSVHKRISTGAFYLHAKDDPPELRYKFFELLRSRISFRLQVIVGRKDITRFVNKHNKQEREFYADLLSHMLHDKANYNKLVLNIADRGSSTRTQNLESAVLKAEELYLKRQPDGEYKAKINFNIQPYRQEPLLSVVDYGLWAVQRVFERGETRFYDVILPKVKSVIDVYDLDNGGHAHFYTPRKPLTNQNRIIT